MTAEAEAVAFFKLQAVRTARALPISDARCFLKGLLVISEDESSVSDIRSVYARLCNFDDQLELIAEEQLKFRELLRS